MLGDAAPALKIPSISGLSYQGFTLKYWLTNILFVLRFNVIRVAFVVRGKSIFVEKKLLVLLSFVVRPEKFDL